MRDYGQYSDEELIMLLRDGEDEVTDYIMEKYKNLVRSMAGSMYILGADRDDLIQEGMIGLFKAVRNYDCGRDASFFTFAELCINRQMYSAIQAAGRMKHIPLNSYISLYGGGEGTEEDEENMMGLFADNGQDPEALVIDQDNVKRLEEQIEKELSGFEKQVFDLHLIGMGYKQIARVLGRDEKSTDNALQRARGKIKKLIIS